MSAPALVDQHGRALPRSRVVAPGLKRLAGLVASPNGFHTPWDAASQTSQETLGWNPRLGSPDSDHHPYRDTIVARVRDVVRNDGWAAGAVARLTDAVVGPRLRLSAKPDYRALRQEARGFDTVWAKEFAAAAEAGFRQWAYDPARWCDTGRRHNFAQIQRMAFRTLLVEGDALAAIPWRPNRRVPGRARYATTVQLVHPDRLSNPNLAMDTRQIRGGVEVDEDGAAVAYHFRDALPADVFALLDAYRWTRMPREMEWGRPNLVHHFEAEDIGQLRASGGILKPILVRLKMLNRYDQVELQAAVINAIFATFIESPFDAVKDALDPTAGTDLTPPAYMQLAAKMFGDNALKVNGVVMPRLLPGESIKSVAANRPSGNFEAFEGAVLRNIASAVGLSYEQLTQDWSKTNYSSARAALIEVWRGMDRRRSDFSEGFCSPIYGAVLEEMMDLGELPMPLGAPDFHDMRAAYSGCAWIGPGRGFVDPVKEALGAQLRIEAGLSAQQIEAAELSGMDFEEILDMQAAAIAMYRERNLPLPASVIGSGVLATQLGEPPEQQGRRENLA